MARAGLRRAIAAAPRDLRYRNDLLVLLQARGRVNEQVVCLREMCLLWPDLAEPRARLGALLWEAGEHQAAVDAMRTALALAPDDADTHCHLGLSLRALGRIEDAAASFTEAIRLSPGFAAAHNNLGLVLLPLGRFGDAERCFRESIRLAPERCETHVNLGNALRIAGRLDAAEASFRTALALRPDYNEAQYSLGALLMISGRLAEGWPKLEARVAVFRQRDLPCPLWHGEPLAGRVLLLHADQGFGDAIQFCRYVPDLARRERVVLEVPKWLTRLMATLPDVDTIVARDSPLPRYDVHCPLTRLPLLAGTTLDNIPAVVPYLHADADAVAGWRHRLAALPGLRVGLVWAGNPNHPDDNRRSVTLSLLAPLGTVPGVVFVSLQKLRPGGDAAAVGGQVLHDWSAELDDFADTAALVSALDLVISVDTAMAHLAGALGKPAWLLNRYDTCWRWMLDRTDSPWYPTLRQFRQTDPDTWDAPVLAMRDELRRLSAGT